MAIFSALLFNVFINLMNVQLCAWLAGWFVRANAYMLFCSQFSSILFPTLSRPFYHILAFVYLFFLPMLSSILIKMNYNTVCSHVEIWHNFAHLSASLPFLITFNVLPLILYQPKTIYHFMCQISIVKSVVKPLV